MFHRHASTHLLARRQSWSHQVADSCSVQCAQNVQFLQLLRGCFSAANVCFLLLQAFEACQAQAAAPVDVAANKETAVPPLKTAGIKWGAADADADVEAAVTPAAATSQPPLQIAGIKWGAVAQPETARSQVRSRPSTA
jgi:hypothetical protein